jgi:oxygen-dependent protoporphyrinogen oxidase
VVVLEELDRVGGRTYSGGDDRIWYNLGAQIVTSPRLLELCKALDLDTVSIGDADFAIGLDTTYQRGSTPEKLFLKLPLNPLQKADFAVTVLRLRRLLHRVPKMSQQEKMELDSKSLSRVIGRVAPTTAQILNGFCEGAAGVPATEVSALMGLVYGLGAYIDPKASQDVRGVRGGTQRICERIAEVLPAGSVRLQSRVTRVEQNEDHVAVSFEDAQGATQTLRARHVASALPASAAVGVFEDLPQDIRRAMLERTPYGSIVAVAWPVRDGVSAPWDGMFFCPISGRSPYSLFTNFSYLGKLDRPELGGHVVTIANAAKAQAVLLSTDAEIIETFYAHLIQLFPEAKTLVDPEGAVVQRWAPVGLPWMRPGSFANRSVLRQPHGRVLFCGDYTAEPGLAGANNSGFHVGRNLVKQLGNEASSTVTR